MTKCVQDKLKMLATSAGALGLVSQASADIHHFTDSFTIDRFSGDVPWDIDQDMSADASWNGTFTSSFQPGSLTNFFDLTMTLQVKHGTGAYPGMDFAAVNGLSNRIHTLKSSQSIGPSITAYTFNNANEHHLLEHFYSRLKTVFGTFYNTMSTITNPITQTGDAPVASGTSHFIGFVFDDVNPKYGWARVTPVLDGRDSTFTIHEWAYEDSGGAIQIGAIPEPHSLALLALGAGGLLAWRKRRS